MTSAKLLILSILFVISTGSFAAERFRSNPLLVMLAIAVSILSTYYLYDSIQKDFEAFADESTLSLQLQVSDLKAESSKAINENQVLNTKVDELQQQLARSREFLELLDAEITERDITFVSEVRAGMTREQVVNKLGEPDKRRRIGNYQKGGKLIEIFYLDDIMLRVLLSDIQAVEQFCVTVLRYGATYVTMDGFIIGRDKFSRLPFYWEPTEAKWDFGNWSGSYRYEESGSAPTVAGKNLDGFFGFHGIQDYFGETTIYNSYIPHYSYDERRLELKIVDSLDKRPTLYSTNTKKERGGLSYSPQQFQLEFENFRRTYTPDTFCSGGSSDFKNANFDLEQYNRNFRQFLRGQ